MAGIQIHLLCITLGFYRCTEATGEEAEMARVHGADDADDARGGCARDRDRQKDEATGRGECGGAPRSGATGETDTAETTRTAEV